MRHNERDRGGTVTEETRLSQLSRRMLIAGAAATPALALTTPGAAQTNSAAEQAQAALKGAEGTKLVLLGTAAGPVPGRARKMTSHVMLSNGSAYVLDCGRGVTDRFAQTGIPFSGAQVDLHHPSPCRPQYRIRAAADRRLDSRPAARRARLWPAAAQAD